MTLAPPSRRFQATRAIGAHGDVLLFDAADRERNGARARLVVLSGTSSVEAALASFRRAERLALGQVGLVRPLVVFEPDAELLRDASPPRSASSARVAVAYDAPGVTLAQRLARGSLTKHEASGIVSGLGAALGGLHDQGVALGCLQPELVFVMREGGVLVAGFGIAELCRALGGSKLGRQALPPAYRAPELENDPPPLAEPWSDVYALGVLTREILETLTESHDERVEALLGRAVSASPAARPADVRRWAAELVEALLSAAPAPKESALLEQTSQLVEPCRPIAEPAPAAAAPSAPAPASPASSAPALASEPELVAPPFVSGAPQKSAERRSPGTLAPAIALISGILLLSAGVGAVFAYVLVAQAAPPPVASSKTVTVPAVPPVVAPAPTARSAPDAGASTLEVPDEPIEEFDPGVAASGPRFSAEDGRAPLPVDASRPVWGSKDALVTLVVFGDLECAHTRQAFRALGGLKHKLRDELRIVWRHRPLAQHPHAHDAALYAASIHARAGDEAFFRLVSNLSRSSAPPTAEELERWTPKQSEQPALDVARAAKLAAERVAQDLMLAAQLRVRATPTLFINGIRVDGHASYDELQRLVERELVGARAALASGVARRELYARRTLKNLVNVEKP